MIRFFFFFFFILAAALALSGFAGPSVYRLRPEDAQAVYLTPENFPVRADGVADATDAVQAAIDRVQETTRRGLVFVPSGRYRLTRPVLIWSGIRLIGYGATRPVFLLGKNTPGYQDGAGKYLFHFVSDRPDPPDQPVRDANPGTFYSAMSNIDLEIGPGNPAAVGVRSHYAQHCFLAHMDFRIGEGRAGVEEVGNESEDLHFFGGEFGLTTHKPVPSWPFLLIDSTFEGQRRAAIETEEGGLTLIRPRFRDLPTAVLVRPDRAEELWMEDARLEHISGPALVISGDQNPRTQVNLRNVVCLDVPMLASFRASGQRVAGVGPAYVVADFSHGLHQSDLRAEPLLCTTCDAKAVADLPAPVASDIPTLPPMETWVNVRTLGAKGDGQSDDTAVLRAAIAHHRAIYLPSGRYRVADTLTLRPDTALLGFNPITTQIVLADLTPAFQGVKGPTEKPAVSTSPGWFMPPPFPGQGAPKALLETSRGGTAIVNGIGLDTGGTNNRAVALQWMAGEHSFVNDVRFLGGHGTYGPDGRWLPIYNANHTADPDPQRRWDSQPASLWVTDGGGGTFKGIWTPSPFAAAGLAVSDTATPGRVYALSSEHHVRNEVKLRRVSNWRIYALQTEEERGESPQALPLEIDACRNLTVANFFIYRVDIPVPFATGIRVTRSRDLHFRGLHVYSPGKLSFDNTLTDVTNGIEVRAREIARLDISGHAPEEPVRDGGAAQDGRAEQPHPNSLAVQKVAGGFTAIDGLAVDAAGAAYFVDQGHSRIYRYSSVDGLIVASDAIPQPVALAVARSGEVLAVSRHGNVYAFQPGASDAEIKVLEPSLGAPPLGAVAWLPLNRWRDSHDWREASTRREPWHYVSTDGSTFVPAPESYVSLTRSKPVRGAGTIDLTRTFGLAPARPGVPFYVADEFGQATWRFRVEANGALTEPTRFAEEGEAGTAVDVRGNVYVCAGQVFVYNPSGHRVKTITVPERPSAVAVGGPDGKTLFIAARTSLYVGRLDR